MGGKIKAGMAFLIVAMAFVSQYVYAGILENEKEELPGETPVIKGYQVQYDEPDGKNGYYHKLPKIRILHQDEGFVTKVLLCGRDNRRRRIESGKQGKSLEYRIG